MFFFLFAAILQIHAADLIIANPLDLNYRFQDSYREAADCLVVVFKDKYYLFASHSGGYWSSTNLYDWIYIAISSIKEIEAYAPAIVAVGNYMYYCGSWGTPLYRTSNPDQDSWTVVKSDFDTGGDPDIFNDDDGRVYHYSGCSPDESIVGRQLNITTGNHIGSTTALIDHHPELYGWERLGVINDGAQGWNEGSTMIKHDGRYFLQYAASDTSVRSYCDSAYVSNNPLGPYTLQASNPFSMKQGGFFGAAGHSNTFKDRYGNYWHISTIAIAIRHKFERRLALFPVYFTADNQIVANTLWTDRPFRIPQEKADFSTDDLSMGWQVLSYGRTATASSTLSGHAVANAVNERIEDWWSASTGNSGEYYQIDLGEAKDVYAVQANFADQDFTIKYPHALFAYQYTVEASNSTSSFQVIVNKSLNQKDSAHETTVIGTTPVRARYWRIVNRKDLPGKFSLYGFRIFGKGNGLAPSEVGSVNITRQTDKRRFMIRWGAVSGAQGYAVHSGVKADGLYQKTLIYNSTSFDAGYFIRDSSYYFRIDSFNENGVTVGSQVHGPY